MRRLHDGRALQVVLTWEERKKENKKGGGGGEGG